MSLVLEGTLSDVGVADLLRLIAREKRSGALRVTIDGSSLHFALRDGRLVGLRCEGGEEDPTLDGAVLFLVRHRRGAFRLEPPGSDDPEEEGEDPMAGLDAEVLADRADAELERLDERIAAAGGDGGRPRRDAFPSPEQMEALEPDARAVYALVNGERDLAEILVRSQLDPARALDALEGLARESLVALEPEPAPAARRTLPRLGGAPAWRDAFSVALPLLVLFAWLGLSGPGVRVEDQDPFRIRHDPLAAARAEHELERLRAVLEAHRFAEGRFPEDLRALAERGYVSESALTDAQGRPYYYALRDEDFVLLAPER